MSLDENGNDHEYEVGEEVWIVRYPLAIKCKITEVNDYFRKQHPAAYLFYDVDEPIGHSLAASELYDDEESAKKALLEDHNGEYAADVDGTAIAITLESRRDSTIAFIKSTWGPGGVSDTEYAKMDKEFHAGI